jgi:FkbM family methyltransferase
MAASCRITYLLEKEYGWKGILAEPNPDCHSALRRNRRCGVSDRCVWSRTGETLRFQVVDSFPALSTVAEFENADEHDRSSATTIEVPTISLNDLLHQHNAPRRIDYISIDTEGSELSILKAFDFGAYDVQAFTIEHNFTAAREKIHGLLASQGYVRVLETFSRWDDWYVRAEIAAQLARSHAMSTDRSFSRKKALIRAVWMASQAEINFYDDDSGCCGPIRMQLAPSRPLPHRPPPRSDSHS